MLSTFHLRPMGSQRPPGEARDFRWLASPLRLRGQELAEATGVRGLLLLLTLRVQVPSNWVRGILLTVIVVLVWGKYMIIGYLDP